MRTRVVIVNEASTWLKIPGLYHPNPYGRRQSLLSMLCLCYYGRFLAMIAT